jgi:hypothetical protein
MKSLIKTKIMTKLFKTLSAVISIILLSSFSNRNVDEFTGTYGVSNSDTDQIRLTINSDHTFYYQDFSIPDKEIVVKGNWTMKNKKVVLNSPSSEGKFHNVWSFVDNGQVAKSRKGLTFYRLCKIYN